MNMNIRVIGSGCVTCKRLHELATQAAQELGLKESVTYSTDIGEIAAMGLMQSPVLAVDGKPVLVGKIFDIDRVKVVIQGTIA